jgi:uncharacterized membrane protein (UPF0127 family)
MKIYNLRFVLFFFLVNSALLVPVTARAENEIIKLLVRDKVIQVEVAQTEQARSIGLMNRSSLCESCGMYFVFSSPGKWAFWSKNTPLALSVAFVDVNGIIKQISDMDANSTISHESMFDVIYAVEMSSGWFVKNGIRAGDKITKIIQ